MVAKRFAEWLERERSRVVPWKPLRPSEAKSNMPLLTVQPDDSVFASGDITKSDTYDLKFRADARGITALRLEALPDDLDRTLRQVDSPWLVDSLRSRLLDLRGDVDRQRYRDCIEAQRRVDAHDSVGHNDLTERRRP